MGYDSDECLICYCDGGFNNPIKERHNICAKCFKEECPNGLRGRANLASYVQIGKNITCSFCNEKGVCLYQVSICSGHRTLYQKSEEENQENIDEDDVCSGRCSCPYCPNNDEEIKGQFI